MSKFLIVILFSILSVGCDKKPDEREMSMTEYCYDGVVYMKKEYNSRTLTVKFNSDSSVATQTIDGYVCRGGYDY